MFASRAELTIFAWGKRDEAGNDKNIKRRHRKTHPFKKQSGPGTSESQADRVQKRRNHNRFEKRRFETKERDTGSDENNTAEEQNAG